MLEIKNLTFYYPESHTPAIDDVTITIKEGEFVTICGPSGCGKTTLLKHLRSSLMPYGKKSGVIIIRGDALESIGLRQQTELVGFVQQSPENQIVTDKVWHELAFGLESLGYETSEIRRRVAEMASFFGIQNWFHKEVAELSGGQKQLLNLASIMAMQPSILVLDEPTSQLDPIAATEFLETIKKINRELGITIILTEHRLEEVLPLSDLVLVMEQGRLIAKGTAEQVGKALRDKGHYLFKAMPTPMRIYAQVPNELPCPITVKQGREWLDEIAKQRPLHPIEGIKEVESIQAEVVLEMKEVYFRYEKEAPDIIRGLTLRVYKGDILAIMGGNGTGKTTSLRVMAGLLIPYRGEVYIQGELLKKRKQQGGFHYRVGILPQNPQILFTQKTVQLELDEMLQEGKLSNEQKIHKIKQVVRLCDIALLLERHPYDLSGGEQQRVALAKILLLSPQILLLDEPTKGLDTCFKEKIATIFKQLSEQGMTIIMVSHDIEFCSAYTKQCALFFDGELTSLAAPRKFFCGNTFYTTAAHRMARGVLPQALLAEDIVTACKGKVDEKLEQSLNPLLRGRGEKEHKQGIAHKGSSRTMDKKLVFEERKQESKKNNKKDYSHRSLTLLSLIIVVIVMPLTLGIGVFLLEDRKYYFISLLILLEIMIPFLLIFERRQPKAREIVTIASLSALAVVGRVAFFMLPQFKPVAAIVILSGVCLGGQVGFLVGAVTAFVSNMLFGQGPWTPWQMFGFGMLGFLSGICNVKGLLTKNKGVLCVFGTFITVFVYGIILDTSSALIAQAKVTRESLLTYYVMGFPFNIIHGVATLFFLGVASRPIIEKLERIKVKYGLLKTNVGQVQRETHKVE